MKNETNYFFSAPSLIFIIIVFFAASALHAQIPNDNLVGFWPYTGNANDISSNGVNGEVNGASLASDRFGNPNSAYSFDGVNDRIVMPAGSGSSLNLTSNLTLAFWFKTSQGLNKGLIGFGDNLLGANGGYLAALGNGGGGNVNGKLTFFSGGNWYNGTTLLNDNLWHHACISLDGSVLRFYIDGQLEISFTGANPPVSFNGLRAIGSRNDGSTAYFTGLIDDVGLWSTSLTAAQINQIYSDQTSLIAVPCVPFLGQNQAICAGTSLVLNATSAPSSSAICPELPSNLQNGLVAFWPFCGNTNDLSGNGNNGNNAGAQPTSDRFGNSNNAYLFNRTTSNEINVSSSASLNNLSNLTISMWVNLSSYGAAGQSGYNHYINKSNQSTNNHFVFANNNTQLYFYYGNGLNFFATNNLPSLNSWNQISVSYNYNGVNTESLCKFYINGVLVDSMQTTVPLNLTADDIKIGTFGAFSYNRVDGKIDDITIHNRSLTNLEIQQLYTLGQTTYLWSNGATTPTITVSPTVSTTYTCTVTTNGVSCTDSVTITVDTPTATITPATATTFCQGGSVVLNANTGTGLSYQWFNNATAISGATSASYTATTSGSYTVVVTNASSCSSTSTATVVTVNALPTATITPATATTFCQGGSVVLNANTGTGLTYQWRLNGNPISGATSSSYTANASGSYTVVVTNASSCSSTSTATVVTVNALPTATITPATATTFCQGGSVVLNANTGTGLTYQWRLNGNPISGATSSSYTANASGSYTVVVTNASSCSSTSTATVVTVNALPTATITPATATTFCQGGSVVLNANTGTGLSYQWFNNAIAISGVTSSAYVATTTGSYTVEVTNAGVCSSTSDAIDISVINSNISFSDSVICIGETATLSVPTSAPSSSAICPELPSNLQNGLVAFWPFCGNTNDLSGNGNNGNNAGAQPTSDRFGNSNNAYLFNRTTSNEINVSSSASLNNLSNLTISMWVNLSSYGAAGQSGYNHYINKSNQSTNNHFVFANNNTQLYFYYGNGLNFFATNNLPSLNSWNQISVSYNYNGVNTESLCKFYINGVLVDSMQTTVPLNLTADDIKIGTFGAFSYNRVDGKIDDITIHNRSLTNLEIQQLYTLGQTTYLWSNGATTPTITVSPTVSTTYTCTVTTNGVSCTDSVTITVDTPTATITPATATTFCQGGSVVLNANTGTGLSYQWFNNATAISGATSASYTATTSGSYTVVVTNASSCSSTSTATVVTVNALPTATITPATATTFCQGGSVVLNANTGTGLTYQWRLNGNPISGATSSSYTANASGSYTVVVTNASSCSSTSTATVVTVNALPTATITPATATTFCQGGSVVLNANTGTGLTYQWRLNGNPISGATSSSYTANASGSYTVVVTNASSCSSTSTATVVTVNALPTATITPATATTFCQGGSVVLNANTGTGLSYQWFNNAIAISGVTSSAYVATTTGSYTVEVTNAGVCSSTSDAIDISVINSNISFSDSVICIGETATLSVPTSAPSSSAICPELPSNLQNGLVAFWPFCGNTNDLSGNGNNGNNAGAQPTSDRFGNSNNAYLFNRTTSNEINVSSSASLNNLSNLTISMWVNLSSYGAAGQSGYNHYINKSNQSTNNHFVFANNNTQLYFYYGNGLNFFATNNLPSLNSWNQISVSYNYNGVNTESLCKFYINGVLVDSMQTTVPLNLTADDIKIGTFGAFSYNRVDGKIDDITIHNRSLTNLEIQQLYTLGQTTYLWSNGATTPTITVSPTVSTTYTCTVTTNGVSCTDSVTITVDTPTATITPATATTFCQGGSVVLNANTGTGLSYQWFNNATAISGATSASYTATTSGSYTVVVTNASSCSSTSTATVVTVNALPTATITPATATTFCQGGSVVLNANTGTGLTYQWRLNGNPISGATSSSYTANASGSYTVDVTNASACSATSSSTEVTTIENLDYFADIDGDGFGDATTFISTCDQPQGYVTNNTDCDDTNVNTFPGATELCNTIDDNCDGQTDEGVQTVYFIDNDGDSYGNPSVSILACTQPNGYTTDDTDCNDTDANINPAAEDIGGNGIDENCDGEIDNSIFEISATINLYPNPTRSELNIQITNALVGNEMYIFDAVGKLVYKQQLLSTQTTLSMAEFADGNYIFRVGELVKRFAVQH